MKSLFLATLLGAVTGLLASGITATAKSDGPPDAGCVQDPDTHLYHCSAS